MQHRRFLSLRFVPDEHVVRQHANQSFAREIVPARDAQRGPNTQLAGRLDVVDLLRSQLDERRDQKQIRVALAEEVVDAVSRWNDGFDASQRIGRASCRERVEMWGCGVSL